MMMKAFILSALMTILNLSGISDASSPSPSPMTLKSSITNICTNNYRIPSHAFAFSVLQKQKRHTSSLMSTTSNCSRAKINFGRNNNCMNLHSSSSLHPLNDGISASAFLPFSDQFSSILSSSSAFASSSLLPTVFRSTGNVPFILSLVLNFVLFFSLRQKLLTMLTPMGFAHSLALGTMLWTTLGWRGWTVCVIYLFLGQLVTKVGFEEKEAMGIAEKRGGRRGPENVWGSAFTGVLCATAASLALKMGDLSPSFLGLSSNVWLLGYVASLATKLADTFASEVGKAYGKTTFLITSLQPVPRGTEGAISLEGTLASVFGGLTLPVYAHLVVGLIPSWNGVGVATFSAFVATMIESLIGATMQEKEGLGWMTNEVVNFFNTLIGASIAMFLGTFVFGI